MLSRILVVNGTLVKIVDRFSHIQACLVDLKYQGHLFKQIMKDKDTRALSMVKAMKKVLLFHCLEIGFLLDSTLH